MAPTHDEPGNIPVFRLSFPYGFIDETGTHRLWQAGQQVSDLNELSLLRKRGVSLEED